MKKFAALGLLLTFLPSQLFGWGMKGHQIVGDIARAHLNAVARQRLVELLGNDDLAAISTWADEVRPQRAETSGWHYVDIPKDAAGFSDQRDCYRPDDNHPSSKTDHQNCVVDRIAFFKHVLADPSASKPDRLEALKFLVHFVGDIHQPMHGIEEARGGNGIHVVEFGSPQCGRYSCNLHYVWDTDLIEHSGRSEQEYVAYLEQMISTKKLLGQGTPEDWANESWQLAKQVWVPDGGAVDQAYYESNIGIVDQRLSLAGLRLAAVLNDALGTPSAQTSTVDLRLDVRTPFRFVTYGDTRFHDPKDTEAANPAVRSALVQAIAQVNPAFICFTGDIVYNGNEADDWKVWDSETAIWRDKRIPVYPALGNHDLHGKEEVALGNYFQRFPDIKGSRYYSVRVANTLILVLDSSMEEVSGPQGQWLADKLDHVPSDVDFVFVMDHHPPYTSSSDEKKFGGGHSARPHEQALAKMLEERQAKARFRMVVFSGHVHNYERHEHGGVTYFVSGGGAAHAYPIERAPGDPFQSKEVNYHYLFVEVHHEQLKITMNRLDLTTGKAVWTRPDAVTIAVPAAAAHEASKQATTYSGHL
jgi:Icc-related predicted phosphoesterase